MTTLTAAAPGRATSTLTQEYDEAHRAAARAAGRPTERTRAPGIFGSPTDNAVVDLALVWTDAAGSLSYFCARESRVPTRLTIHALDWALALPPRDPEDPKAQVDTTSPYVGLAYPRRLVVSDHQTLRRLMAWVNVAASTAPDADYTAASVHRRLVVASRLVASTRLIVLTRALARKFWLGSQYDPEDFGAWRRAFGFGAGASIVSVMGGLIEQASEGKVFPKWGREAFGAESYALMSAAFPGLRSAVAAFGRIETADTAARAILTTDPLLRERSVLDGSVSTMTILTMNTKDFTASVSTPFKLRAGKRILLIDPQKAVPGGWAETQLDAVTVAHVGGQDQLIAKVSTGSRRAGTALAAVITAAMDSPGRKLLVAENPYLPFTGSASRALRWTQPSALRVEADAAAGPVHRDIPLDVIVSGAPTT